MLNRLQTDTIRSWLLSLFLSFALSSAHADSSKAADVVAVGLPLVAAGISMYHGDTDGVWQLAKSEAVTLAVTEILKATVHKLAPMAVATTAFLNDTHQSHLPQHSSCRFAEVGPMGCRHTSLLPPLPINASIRKSITPRTSLSVLLSVSLLVLFSLIKPYKAALSYSPSDRAVLTSQRQHGGRDTGRREAPLVPPQSEEATDRPVFKVGLFAILVGASGLVGEHSPPSRYRQQLKRSDDEID